MTQMVLTFEAMVSWSNLMDKELKLVHVLRENLLFQHVVQMTRQRGSDMLHMLDLIITSDNFLTDIGS